MTTLSRVLAGFVVVLSVAVASPSWAASLSGDTIAGSLTFCALNNGANNFTVDSIVAPDQFGWTDGANIDTAVFSGTTLTVSDQVLDVACGWGMTFSDTTTQFPALTLVSSNFSPDLSYSLTGGVIALQWGGSSDQQTFTAVFNIDGTVATPEPSALALLSVGVAGACLIRQRRRLGSPS
jgi:hypothetical protein